PPPRSTLVPYTTLFRSTDTARHMANATLDWRASERLNLFLTAQANSKRYADQHPVTDESRYFRDFTVLHLGASYQVNDAVTLNRSEEHTSELQSRENLV